jgi:hypothetical protein
MVYKSEMLTFFIYAFSRFSYTVDISPVTLHIVLLLVVTTLGKAKDLFSFF